jgi:hypothetical protein
MAAGKVCAKCKLFKPLDWFWPHQLGKLGRVSLCKNCANQAARERYRHNVQEPIKRRQIQARQAARYRARTAEQNKRYRRRSHIGRYGYTTESFAAHLERIGNTCEICGCSFERDRNRHIDHDHAGTRKDVRGILCSACNYNLGYLRTIGGSHEIKALGFFLGYLDQFDRREKIPCNKA